MSKQPVRKAIPTFSSEAEERTFWETHDSSTFVEWRNARVAVFPNLKASTETTSLRLPAALLAELKALANKRDVPYQSLLKVFLAERVDRETNGINEFTTTPKDQEGSATAAKSHAQAEPRVGIDPSPTTQHKRPIVHKPADGIPGHKSAHPIASAFGS